MSLLSARVIRGTSECQDFVSLLSPETLRAAPVSMPACHRRTSCRFCRHDTHACHEGTSRRSCQHETPTVTKGDALLSAQHTAVPKGHLVSLMSARHACAKKASLLPTQRPTAIKGDSHNTPNQAGGGTSCRSCQHDADRQGRLAPVGTTRPPVPKGGLLLSARRAWLSPGRLSCRRDTPTCRQQNSLLSAQHARLSSGHFVSLLSALVSARRRLSLLLRRRGT